MKSRSSTLFLFLRGNLQKNKKNKQRQQQQQQQLGIKKKNKKLGSKFLQFYFIFWTVSLSSSRNTRGHAFQPPAHSKTVSIICFTPFFFTPPPSYFLLCVEEDTRFSISKKPHGQKDKTQHNTLNTNKKNLLDQWSQFPLNHPFFICYSK